MYSRTLFFWNHAIGIPVFLTSLTQHDVLSDIHVVARVSSSFPLLSNIPFVCGSTIVC